MNISYDGICGYLEHIILPISSFVSDFEVLSIFTMSMVSVKRFFSLIRCYYRTTLHLHFVVKLILLLNDHFILQYETKNVMLKRVTQC